MSLKDQDPVDQYPTLILMLRHRKLAIFLGAALPLLIGVWAAWRSSVPDWAILGIIGAASVGVALRGVLELVDLVTDLLVPR